MIRSAVTVSLVEEARGGPFVFWHDLPDASAQAAALGFDGVEVFPPGPEALTGDVGKLLNDHGLRLAAVGTGAGWVRHRLTLTHAEAEARHRAREFVRGLIDAAGALGAPAIIGSMQGRWGEGVSRETALGWLREALAELGQHAGQYGVPLLYEPLNRYETNLATTVEAALPLAGGNVKLLCDLFHMNIEEADLAAALCRGGAHVGHVHFVDSNRRPAGMGHLDYAPLARALQDIGYAGFLSAEALPYPDTGAAARQTIATFRHYFPR